jgi:anti-sigma factor ChrR (cupin superfamily)
MIDNTAQDLLAIEPELRDALLERLRPVDLSAARRVALRGAVLAQAQSDSGARILRADEGEWRQLISGIEVRALRVDAQAGTQTSLWRLAPGASIPAHSHTGEEECLVLEGDIDWQGKTYRQGDYLLARPGLHHDAFLSRGGALLMIRSELTDPLRRVFDGASCT